MSPRKFHFEIVLENFRIYHHCQVDFHPRGISSFKLTICICLTSKPFKKKQPRAVLLRIEKYLTKHGLKQTFTFKAIYNYTTDKSGHEYVKENKTTRRLKGIK